jgi:PPP family 3-phenylpropionic acid transporter
MIGLVRVKILFALSGVAEAAMLPFFSLFLLGRGFKPEGIGLVLSLVALAGFLASPAWGYLADQRLGPERALAAGGVGAAGLALLLFLPGHRLLLVAAAVVLWVARSPLTSLIDAIALERLGPARRTGYGGVRLWMSAGWALAVVVWGAVLGTAGLRVLPGLYALAILAVALWVKLGLQLPARTRVGAAVPSRSLHVRALPLPLLAFLASLLLLNASFTATWNFLALRINGLGGGALLIGVAASLQALAEIPAMASISRLARRVSHRFLYLTGCGIYLAVFVAWALLSDPVVISSIKLVMGVGFALAYVGTVVIVDDLVPPGRRATGQGLAKAVGVGLAPILGTLGGGLLYGLLGPRAMFLAAAGAAAGAAAIAWFAVSEPETGRLEVASVAAPE